jgi:ABC-type multidrug transport system ATPase subunit
MPSIIEIQNLFKRFQDVAAVDGLSFKVAEGEFFGLLGPNGAGKTTTIRMLYGFSPPSRGLIRIFGLDITRDWRRIKSRIGVCQQDNTLDPDLSVEQNLLVSRSARLLASPISSNVQKAVEQTFGLDSVQITPYFIDPNQQTARFSPGAHLTIGKRISDRIYVTYSRSLTSTARDQVILLEYDQSDRLAWIVTQNEDRTYAVDVRVRHVF